MERYIIVGGHILELPILTGILTLVVLSVITLWIFFFGFRLKKPRFKKILVVFLGLVLLFSISGAVFVYNEGLHLDLLSNPITPLKKDNAFTSSPNHKQTFNFRYTLSHRLNNLGFVRDVYDDGNNTYFNLNSLNAPTVFSEDSNGDLVDQKDYIRFETTPDQPFPILIVDKLSTVWYLQFNNLISHIRQTPVFKRSYDAKSVEVFYSDLFFTRLEILKDSFICSQLSPQDKSTSILYARHYFIFENIRYYIDNCFIDYVSD